MICLLGGSTEGGRGQKKWELNKSWEQKGTAFPEREGDWAREKLSQGGEEGGRGREQNSRALPEMKWEKKLLCSSFSPEQRELHGLLELPKCILNNKKTRL